MDSSRFDDLTKALATSTSRRQALKAFGASVVGGILGLSGIDTALAHKPFCRGNGSKCNRGSDCCSGYCANNVCTCPPAPACNSACPCPSDSTCLNGTCCPTSQACNGACCPSGTVCVNGACCPTSQACNGTCCPSGTTCVNGACCPTSQVCNGTCCPSGTVCVNGTCAHPCTSDADCSSCLSPCGPDIDGVHAYCEGVPTGIPCSSDSGCPAGTFCTDVGECETAC